ncbi:hypothetical protein K439DRAFT_251837 [Ramaria rubella]|nr:hypothetical protein K439DRAFT_251837 [Ramaria rubella]
MLLTRSSSVPEAQARLLFNQAKLSAMATTLLLKMSDTHNQLAPINRLPLDTLALIHEASLISYDVYQPQIWGRYPLRLSHVCRHWRRAASENAFLWTRLESPSHPEIFLCFLREHVKHHLRSELTEGQ